MTAAIQAPSVPAACQEKATRQLRAVIPVAARVIDHGYSITAEQLIRMPEPEGKRELVDGRIIDMAPAGGDHGEAQVNASVPLSLWNRQHKLGRVFVETGFIFARNPDLVRSPDVSFLRNDHLPAGADTSKFIEAAPDLAVEVKSPGDTMPELRSKAAEYLQFGVSLVWLVNLQHREIEIFRPDAPPTTLPTTLPVTLGENDTLDGGDVLPGFTCKVADLL